MDGFPVHPNVRGRKNARGIEHIPWEVIQPHEDQALANHMQSLQRLAERGGLDWYELYNVLNDKNAPYDHRYKQDDYMYAVLRMIGIFYCRRSEI